jgi:hypothetical protein
MARETEYQKFEKELREFGAMYKTAIAERDAAIKMVTLLAEALNAPEWQHIWKLLNAFASGETQNQFARVEPIAVLADTYQGCAMIYERGRAALKALSESGLIPEEKTREDHDHAEVT